MLGIGRTKNEAFERAGLALTAVVTELSLVRDAVELSPLIADDPDAPGKTCVRFLLVARGHDVLIEAGHGHIVLGLCPVISIYDRKS